MANYCTAEDVKVLLRMNEDFDATTTPTLTQVNQEIDNITKEIDVYLTSIGVTTQPTDSNVLGMLRKYAGYGSACRVGMTYKRNSDSVKDSQADHYCEKYSEFLEFIRNNPDLFLDSTGGALYFTNQVNDGEITQDDLDDLLTDLDFEV
jgi:hypothetical protein